MFRTFSTKIPEGKVIVYQFIFTLFARLSKMSKSKTFNFLKQILVVKNAP